MRTTRPRNTSGRATVIAVATASFWIPGAASASPRPLPFTYTYETLAEGEGELETYVDLTPLRAADSSGNPATVLASQLQEEFEYGITARLELGLYATYTPSPGGYTFVPSLTEGNGSKQRLRYRFREAGVLPVDLGVYGEVTENEREVELEAKAIFQRRVGPLAFAANVVVEHEWYFAGQNDWVFDPSAGLWLHATPVVQPGFEGWMRKEWTSTPTPVGGTPFNLRLQAYVGPTMLLSFGKVWWTTGAYLRVSDVGHDLTVGEDAFGRVWFRTVIGVSL